MRDEEIGIIFDCDGTLVDSESAHYAAWRHAVQRQGGDLSVEEYTSYVGNSVETNAALLAGKMGRECAEEIARDKVVRFRELQAEGLPAIGHTVDFLHRLARERKQWGLKLGLASAVAKEEILIHLWNLGIEAVFDVVLSGHDDLPKGCNKPKPHVYLEAAKRLGLAPSECIVIEDSHTGVAAGVAAGCFTIAVPNSFSRRQDFSKAHLKIDSFEGMSAAHFLQAI